MSNSARKRVRKHLGLPVNREPLPEFAWPGGYPLFYPFTDGGVMCPGCVNRHLADVDAAVRGEPCRVGQRGGWAVLPPEPNWEDDALYCDQCGRLIPSAYGEPAETTNPE